jgi:hypothetical protein
MARHAATRADPWENTMPLDDETRRRLLPVRDGLVNAAQALDALLTGAPEPLSRDARIELLGKTYTRASDYDRHYSTTRSALTGLVITIGLAAAADPIKAVLALTPTSPACVSLGTKAHLLQAILPFAPTLLMFLLAVVVNVYFQRLTAACEIIESEVERRLGELAPDLYPAGSMRAGRVPGITGYAFRTDLRIAFAKTSVWHPEAMKLLLVLAILVFIAFVAGATWWRCTPP